MARDFDFLQAVAALLAATKQYDDVSLCSTPEITGRPASELAFVGIEITARDVLDDYDSGLAIWTEQILTLQFTFIYRHTDPIIRDRNVDYLIAVAESTLDRANPLSATIPDKNRFTKHRWLPAIPPERRVISTYQLIYPVDGVASIDTSAG